MTRRALITGISGQDGSYLAEFLLEKGYEVYGIVRRVALELPETRLSRLTGVLDRVKLISGSVECYASVLAAVKQARPDECYHLAAQSFVTESFADPHSTMLVNVQGTLHVLESCWQLVPECRVYFAATSEMFGQVEESPQHERSRFHPRSPYAVSKVAGYHLVRNYREAYEMHASSGICMNHESRRRGLEFVTRKITRGVAEIRAGRKNAIQLGNLEAKRDWGHAADFVRAMWLMLQQTTPDDYVIATGKMHTVGEFAELAFRAAGLDWREYVKVDPKFYRPAEVNLLCGDATKARDMLGWVPTISFDALVCEMVENDCAELGVHL